MKNRHFWIGLILYWLVAPVLLNIVVIFDALFFHTLMPEISVAIGILFYAGLTALYIWRAKLPKSAITQYMPILVAYIYFMLLFVVSFPLSGYSRYGSDGGLFVFGTLQLFIVHLYIAFTDKLQLFPIIISAMYAMIFVFTLLWSKVFKKSATGYKKLIIPAAICLALALVCGWQFIERERVYYTPPNSEKVERVSHEIDYYEYSPFSTNNKLVDLDEPATISISSDYPRLDGATAAYPVYGAMVQEVYQGLDLVTVNEYVDCNTTTRGYERLIDGEIDIFFGAQPSQQQIELAAEEGLEFTLTPIAKEAFVFFVNKENPVGGLTIQQVRSIYTKEITNWSKVGGANESIMPYQRPENSGSQTIMLAKVMDGKGMAAPQMEEIAGMMGDAIIQVAEYRNVSSAIGYSFRFYATGMNPNHSLKLLAIDGVEPSVENIRSGAYPFTVEVYAVTIGQRSENTQLLIDWILSAQGQRLIEKCGYVGI